MASKILHPDKVKNQEDEKLKTIMSEQFCKAALAKEPLVIPAGDHAALQRRNTCIRRYLWTEQELAHESSAWGAVDDSMRGEETTHSHLKENFGDAIRVLPGIGLLQGHLLQAFSRRGLSKTKKSAHLTKSTAGFTEEKSLAVVQVFRYSCSVVDRLRSHTAAPPSRLSARPKRN